MKKIPHETMIKEFMLEYRNAIILDVWRMVQKDGNTKGFSNAHSRLQKKLLEMRDEG